MIVIWLPKIVRHSSRRSGSQKLGKMMNRFILLPLLVWLTEFTLDAADTAPPAAVGSLADVEARRPSVVPSDPGYWESAIQVTKHALQLIEGNTLKSADELFRVSHLVLGTENR